MSSTYLTRHGEMLDAIAQRIYGTTQAVHDLIKANPSISRHGPRLPAGLVLTLPDLPSGAGPAAQTIRLWGNE